MIFELASQIALNFVCNKKLTCLGFYGELLTEETTSEAIME